MSGSDFGSPPSTALRTSFAPSAGSASTSSEVCPAPSTSQQDWQMQTPGQAQVSHNWQASSLLSSTPASTGDSGGFPRHGGRGADDCAGGKSHPVPFWVSWQAAAAEPERRICVCAAPGRPPPISSGRLILTCRPHHPRGAALTLSSCRCLLRWPSLWAGLPWLHTLIHAMQCWCKSACVLDSILTESQCSSRVLKRHPMRSAYTGPLAEAHSCGLWACNHQPNAEPEDGWPSICVRERHC